MNVQEFQNKLKEIQTIAKANGNSLTTIQIRDTFAGMELDKTQLLGVLKYLTSQGIISRDHHNTDSKIICQLK